MTLPTPPVSNTPAPVIRVLVDDGGVGLSTLLDGLVSGLIGGAVTAAGIWFAWKFERQRTAQSQGAERQRIREERLFGATYDACREATTLHWRLNDRESPHASDRMIAGLKLYDLLGVLSSLATESDPALATFATRGADAYWKATTSGAQASADVANAIAVAMRFCLSEPQYLSKHNMSWDDAEALMARPGSPTSSANDQEPAVPSPATMDADAAQ